MDGKSSSERRRLPAGGSVTRKVGWRRDTVGRDSGIRGRDAGKGRAHDHQKVPKRQYLQIRERRGLVREILSRPRCSAETRSTRTNCGDGREASPDRVGRHRCCIEQKPCARARRLAGAEICGTSVYSAEIRKRRLAEG